MYLEVWIFRDKESWYYFKRKLPPELEFSFSPDLKILFTTCVIRTYHLGGKEWCGNRLWEEGCQMLHWTAYKVWTLPLKKVKNKVISVEENKLHLSKVLDMKNIQAAKIHWRAASFCTITVVPSHMVSLGPLIVASQMNMSSSFRGWAWIPCQANTQNNIRT